MLQATEVVHLETGLNSGEQLGRPHGPLILYFNLAVSILYPFSFSSFSICSPLLFVPFGFEFPAETFWSSCLVSVAGCLIYVRGECEFQKLFFCISFFKNLLEVPVTLWILIKSWIAWFLHKPKFCVNLEVGEGLSKCVEQQLPVHKNTLG